jgi:hypothetical protein
MLLIFKVNKFKNLILKTKIKLNILYLKERYWPNLNDYKKYIKMSHNQFISSYTE